MACPATVEVIEPCAVGVSDLVTNVRWRFDVPQARATNAVWHVLHNRSRDAGSPADVADLSAWDVLYVLDQLADFEWEDF